MRKRTLGVVLLAGLAMSGAGAFTASNTIADSTAGYGTGDVSGVAVTDTNYTLSVTDNSKVTAMSFTHADDLALKTVLLELKNAGSDITGDANTCVPGTGGLVKTVCTFTVAVNIAAFDGFALTVHQ